ncbi:MAG: hypothetical protein ABS80_20665 [Pseudonocardia sp. SCN 72-51]|mgnify:CR=1 FL=1|nr:MAG: hypothetical protein ABS80_20665 [Pseudonocardia sp. SCN 72-51]
MATFSLPALTLPDPQVSGEGALDPLGLANFADRLAEEMIPGVRARQNRVRFVTAIAVAAAVLEDLDDSVGSDGSTTPQLAFEWLLVEGLARAADPDSYRGTAGSFKARDAVERQVPMSAKTYLKTPTVFGFHGVYKTLAIDLRVVDRDMRLDENGRLLVDAWEREQGLAGFVERAIPVDGDSGWNQRLRSAVESALSKGHTDQAASWAGWKFFATHLGPSTMGRREAKTLFGLLADAEAGTRSEVFRLLEGARVGGLGDGEIAHRLIAPGASAALHERVEAIEAYEQFCAILEYAFDAIRHAGRDPLRPASPSDYLPPDGAAVIARLQPAIVRAERALECLSPSLQTEWGEIVGAFSAVRSREEVFQAILGRHHTVQERKPPAGKRDWLERTTSGDAIVRPLYRADGPPELADWWRRPYRLMACLRFTQDIQGAGHGQA